MSSSSCTGILLRTGFAVSLRIGPHEFAPLLQRPNKQGMYTICCTAQQQARRIIKPTLLGHDTKSDVHKRATMCKAGHALPGTVVSRETFRPVCLVLGSGPHTASTLLLTAGWQGYSWRFYPVNTTQFLAPPVSADSCGTSQHAGWRV
jgi:hypothetical protein